MRGHETAEVANKERHCEDSEQLSDHGHLQGGVEGDAAAQNNVMLGRSHPKNSTHPSRSHRGPSGALAVNRVAAAVSAPRMTTPTDHPSTQNAWNKKNIRSKTSSTDRDANWAIVMISMLAKIANIAASTNPAGHIRRSGRTSVVAPTASSIKLTRMRSGRALRLTVSRTRRTCSMLGGWTLP